MNSDKLGSWLSLIANVGVVIGLIVVVIELRQTQSSLEATAHRDRTESNITRSMWGIEQGTAEIRRKVLAGDEITPRENDILRASSRMGLRHFEDLHFQRSLGNVDDETWSANLVGMTNLANSGELDYESEFERAGFRESFEELILSLRKD